MSLDITAYKQIKVAENQWLDEYEEPLEDGGFDFWVNPDFPNRANVIIPDKIYVAADTYRFRAGSYSSYNYFRERLALVAGWENIQECWNANSGCLWELINFSDCEGTLDTEVCQKLLKDIQSIKTPTSIVSQDDECFWSKFNDWVKALEFASDNGAISFR